MTAALSKVASLVRGLASPSARHTWSLFSGRSPVLNGPLYEAKLNELVRRVDLDAFVRNTDGTWTATRRVKIRGPWGRATLAAGQAVMPDRAYAGLNLFALLERGVKSEQLEL